MARSCEPEIREHVTMRMKRRAENQKREMEAAGRPTPVARAIPPHYTSIQNVRFQLPELPNDLNLPAHRRPASPPPKLSKVRIISTMSSSVWTSGSPKRMHTSIRAGVPFSPLSQQGGTTTSGLWSHGYHHLHPDELHFRRDLAR